MTTSVAAGPCTSLVARTRDVERPARLLDALAPDGFAWLTGGVRFVTAGEAMRVPVAEVAAALARIEVDDPLGRPGTGAVAVGALPFADAGNGEAVIPTCVTGIDSDGRAWRTEIGAPAADVTPSAPLGEHEPTAFRVEGRVSRATWSAQVRALLEAIESGRLDKAVLARDVVVRADAPFDPRTVVDRLDRTQPGCAVFAADGLVGATPELLVRRRGDRVVSRPMAGTIARGSTGEEDDAAETDLASSIKNGWEHRLVVDAVVTALRDCGVEVTAVTGPDVARLATVSHLATTIAGRIDAEAGPSALDVARALHPTPAVGGSPHDAALAMLRELETFDRARYAGPVGWVDGRGDGEWAVALRCAELDGACAHLVAGAGIVAGSDPDAEWAETQAKFEPMLRALVQP
jgi:menaquinone-specific isochorismate synthase